MPPKLTDSRNDPRDPPRPKTGSQTMTDDAQIHLIARLVPRAGQEAALAQAMTTIVPQVLQEPGCLAYVAHVSRDQPGTVVMVETWANQAALDAHNAAPALAWLIPQLGELLAEPLALEFLRRI